MATSSPTTHTPTTDTTKTTNTARTGLSQSAKDVAQDVAQNVATTAGDVTARIPDIAQGTREAIAEANRMVHHGSDPTLRLVGAATIGFAAGLLVGGANRLLVIASLIPAALIGTTMVERMDGRTRTSGARVQGS
ncbi:hypothetical protein BH20CHL7_BH20CHL7_10810 [soil metagenome]